MAQQEIEQEWIRSQLAPIGHDERVSSLRYAIAFVESLSVDPEIADRNPPSRAALAWIRHFEHRFMQNIFSSRNDVLARMRAELIQIEAAADTWDVDEYLAK
ncbi:MAG TPA: hypothetical protein VFB90_03525 [Dehalococcoidia bacterium]|nr:hypothetical protein [Dehalococcoidia bacterium]